MNIQPAIDEKQIRSCFPVMAQLRTRYDEESFLTRVLLQQKEGYRLVGLEADGKTVAAAGYRIGNNLAWGKYLYVDDLVTDETVRSKGHGGAMLRWLMDEARRESCDQLHLDSGVQRFEAHRFYLFHGMNITSHHFQISLGSE